MRLPHLPLTRLLRSSCFACGGATGGSKNREHWLRDAVFGEDANTTHLGCAPQAFAAFRNLALSWLHLGPDRNLTAAREYYASHLNVLFRRLQLTPAGL